MSKNIHEMEPAELAYFGLSMWANYIETGDVNLGAKDAAAAKRTVRPLSLDQMRAVIHLRDTAALFLSLK